MWPFDPLVVVSDPRDVKRIFTGDPAQLHAGEGNQVLGPIVGPHSVLVLDERPHLRTRKLLLPPFHGARMRVYGDVMRELAEAEVATWPLGEPFPLLPAMQRLTLRIILRTVFGVDEGARMAELERALGRLTARGHADHADAAAAARLGPRQPAAALRGRPRGGRRDAASPRSARRRASRRARRRRALDAARRPRRGRLGADRGASCATT